MHRTLRFAPAATMIVAFACAPSREPASVPAAAPERSPPVRVAEVPRAPAPAQTGEAPAAEAEPKAESAPAASPETEACVRESKLSHCVPLFEGNVDDLERASFHRGTACTRGCIERFEERNKPTLSAAADACVKAYVAAKGKKPAKCVIPIAKRPSDARIVSIRFQDALRAAVEKGDAKSMAALDAMMPVLDAKLGKDAVDECHARCRKLGDESLASAKP